MSSGYNNWRLRQATGSGRDVSRAGLFRRGYRPKIADTLIAQSCLDHRVPLITRDRDFSCFQKFAGLQLLVMGDLLQ